MLKIANCCMPDVKNYISQRGWLQQRGWIIRIPY